MARRLVTHVVALGAILLVGVAPAGLGSAPPATGGRPAPSLDAGLDSVPAVPPFFPAPPAAAAGATGVNVYAATTGGRLSPKVAGVRERVYVPNSGSDTVFVIDPRTYEVVDRFVTGAIPHHVAPAWDLDALYVDNEGGSNLTVVDPRTGRPSASIPVAHPYNLYFTPDGAKAIVVVERLRRLDFHDPHSWALLRSVAIPWAGADHLDFSADGRYAFISTEFTGMLARVDVAEMALDGAVHVGGLPIDVRLAPDGELLYVANQGRNGVSLVDPAAMKEIGFIPTGLGAHGLQVSRDARSLYVSNRLNGTISVIDFATQRVTAVWQVGGSPDMMQLNPRGDELWVSGRFDSSVYVVDTASGSVTHRVAVGPGAHGLTYFPNAGNVSLGHNGVYR